MGLRMVSNFWELSRESYTAIDLVKLSVSVLNLLKQGHLFIFYVICNGCVIMHVFLPAPVQARNLPACLAILRTHCVKCCHYVK